MVRLEYHVRTPQALPTNPKSYDLESLMIHELGHLLGFSHTAVWSAMMFPYAPAPGTYAGQRPTVAQPDGPLSDDDRTGLRVLYADPTDTLHTGSVSGRIVPANPLSLPENPPGVTGIFGAQVVAVNAATGEVVAATLGGWSCTAPGPAVFDGSYTIGRLPVGASYTVYAEPLNGSVGPSQVVPALDDLCRNSTTDPGWPPLQGVYCAAAGFEFYHADVAGAVRVASVFCRRPLQKSVRRGPQFFGNNKTSRHKPGRFVVEGAAGLRPR